MTRAYSDDLREKVLGAYALGKGTLRELAERFDVSYGWVAKIHAAELQSGARRRGSAAPSAQQRRRRTGAAAPSGRASARAYSKGALHFLMRKILLALCFFFACRSTYAQDNSTVRALFVEDQRDRGLPFADDGVHMLPKAEADKLPDHSRDFGVRDVGRLKEAKTLLGNGGLVTAHDFRYAAILFQHGEQPDDYLMAHVLAIRAIGLGDLSSQNLAALTLDRYLQSIGRGQIFGSQYLTESYAYRLQHSTDKNVDQKAAAKGEADTLQPYDESLVPDSLRHAFCIASLSEQKKAIEDAHKTKHLEIPVVGDYHFK